MINLIPTTSTKRTDTLPEVSGSLFNDLFKLYESYYNKLYELQTDFSNEKVLQEATTWLLSESSQYISKLNTQNYFLKHQLKVISRAIDPRYIDKNMIYENTTYHIPRDIKLEFPIFPQDMVNEFEDTFDIIEKAIHDDKLFEKVMTKLFFVAKLPMWFYKHRTEESMIEYLYKHSATVIYEGAYPIRKLVPMLENYLGSVRKYFESIQEQIKRANRQFGMFRDRIDSQLTKIDKAYPQEKVKVFAMFESLKHSFEIIFLQISVYHKSVIRLYSSILADIGNVIKTMFLDLSDPYVKHSSITGDFNFKGKAGE